MAGDTYSFIIEGFEERNCGRYTIQAENQYGKATCSAEILFEGSLFSSGNELSVQAPCLESCGNIITEEIYSKSGSAGSEMISRTETKTIKTESKSIETMPVHTRDLSIQSIIPQMKDMSSQSNLFNTKDTGIQSNPDQRDKSSQLEFIKTRDEASQWLTPDAEIKRITTHVVNESTAPFVTSEERRFSSVNESNNMSTSSHSYSYTQQTSVTGAPTVIGGSRLRIDTSDHNLGDVIGLTIRSTPEPAALSSTHIDFSTTLIKDINQNKHQFEPVELIVNSSASLRGPSPFAHHNMSSATSAHNSSNTYIADVDEFHHKPMNRFEPINLIIQKPTCGLGRSGSLPPIRSRINYKSSSVRNDFDHMETDDEASYYYMQQQQHKENLHSYGPESKMAYYKEIERRSHKPAFKPVELILDASTLSDSGKRYRDSSCPTNMKRVRHLPASTTNNHQYSSSSFIYDDTYENDSSNSDFISDRIDANEARFAKYSTSTSMHQQRSSVSSIDDRYNRQERRHSREASYPKIEMTIDLKAPPTIDVPLKSVHANEGQTVKLECVVSGKHLIFSKSNLLSDLLDLL